MFTGAGIRFGLVAVTLLSSSAVVRAAEEEYDLRGPAPVKGQIITLSSKTNYKNAVRTIKTGGNTIEDRFNEVTTKEKETEVLAVENGVATRVRVKVVKDVSEESRAKGKRTARATRPNRLDGQVLFGELVKGEWKYTLDDVTPTPEQKRALKEYQPFRAEDELLPSGKVKVGHEWEIGKEQFQKVLGNQLTDIDAKGSAKFLRVEKDGDDSIAILEMKFELTGKTEEDGLKMEMKLSGKHQIHRSLKTGYDIKESGTGKMSVKGKGEIDGEKVEIDFSADIVDEETSKVKASR
jgi:ribosomal protein S6E (S10)